MLSDNTLIARWQVYTSVRDGMTRDIKGITNLITGSIESSLTKSILSILQSLVETGELSSEIINAEGVSIVSYSINSKINYGEIEKGLVEAKVAYENDKVINIKELLTEDKNYNYISAYCAMIDDLNGLPIFYSWFIIIDKFRTYGYL